MSNKQTDNVEDSVLESIVEDYVNHSLAVKHILKWVRRLVVVLIASCWIVGALIAYDLRATQRVEYAQLTNRAVVCSVVKRIDTMEYPDGCKEVDRLFQERSLREEDR